MPDHPTVDLSVVVPVYRNAPTLAPLTAQVLEATGALGLRAEIVFVNDASPDDSGAQLAALAARCRAVSVVELPENVGQHAAVLHGLARARGQACVVMDADLQDRPSSIATLWRARAPGTLAVFGGRRGWYEAGGRHVTSRLFKFVLHQLTGIPKDAGIFVLIERELIDALVRFPTSMPWIQAMIGCLRVPVRSIPVDRDPREAGTSSYSALGRLRTAARGLLCVLEYRLWRASTPWLDANDPDRRPVQRGRLSPKRVTKS